MRTYLMLILELLYTYTYPILVYFQSVYPPRLSLGPPKRHHAVVYLYAKLKPEITSTILQSNIKIDPSEVGASAWFDRSKVKAIVSVKEGEGQTSSQAQEFADVKFRYCCCCCCCQLF